MNRTLAILPFVAALLWVPSLGATPAFNYFNTATNVTPSNASTGWKNVDVSGSVPAGATGVILKWVGGGSDENFGLRKNGSTDGFFTLGAKNTQSSWVMIGVDTNRIFQAYTISGSGVTIYLLGYTMSGVTFFTDRIDKSLSVTGAWTDVDISADTPDTAIGAVFMVRDSIDTAYQYGLRKNGSTDNRLQLIRSSTLALGLIGVDSAEIAEMYIQDTVVKLYLVGYVTSGAVFYTNGFDKSAGTFGSYVPVDITNDIGGQDANGAIVEVITYNNMVALRPNGASYNIYPNTHHGFCAVGIDAADIFEQKIETAAEDLFLVGFTLEDGGLAVSLASFEAKASDRAVSLTWETSSELSNLGFHVYRAASAEGPYQKITALAIPGLGSSPTGARYSYVDSGVENGVTYFYKLEDIDAGGKTELHGPVSATPAPASSLINDGFVGHTSMTLTYGNPSFVVSKVVGRTEREMVLELTTPGFFAEPEPDGSVRLSVPGLTNASEAGAPAIPVWRSWVEAVAGRGVRVASVETRDVEFFSSRRPTITETREVIGSADGTFRLARRPPAAAARSLRRYPREWAQVVKVGFQADVEKALLELAPVRWDGEQLILARTLRVRLVFDAEARGAADARRHVERGSHERRVVSARLTVREKGLQAVTFEEIMGARRRVAIPARSLRLSRLGVAVPFHVEPDPEVFAPGSTLYFVSEGASANPYGNEVVYELERGRDGSMMESVSAPPSGPPVASYLHREMREENRYYQAGLLEATDVWLWDVLMAPVEKSYPFEVADLAATDKPAWLEVALQGASDVAGTLDHHVRVRVNETAVGEVSFDGKRPRRFSVEIAAGVLREGVNQLRIENVGDTGASTSMVMLDRFEVEYPRRMRADRGSLEGTVLESGVAQVDRLTEGARVVEWTETGLRWLEGIEVRSGSVRFRVEAGRKYLLVDREAVARPSVTRAPSSRLKSGLNQADYLMVGPRQLLEASHPLLELRRRDGLLSRAVDIEEIYSEFGFGERRPQALRDFFSYAYHHWRRRPRYVLLVGDGTYDFKDYLKTGVANQVPPFIVKTTYLWTAADWGYVSVDGEDELPDLAIGRLPGANRDEVRVMVDKLVKYETGEKTDEGPVVLVADDPDGAGDFEAAAEDIAVGILETRQPKRIYLRELGAERTREAIALALDEGVDLMSYIGHGGIDRWAGENVFSLRDIERLGPQAEQPLVLTLNCLNGYFHFPYFDSLAEALVKAEGKGAVAAVSPSGLSLNQPAHLFHKLLLTELLSGAHARLGDALMAAQVAYARTGALPELLRIYHLFGDPAMKVH